MNKLTTQEIANILDTIPIFAKLPPGETEKLAELVNIHTVKAGQILFNQGDPSKDIYILVLGQLEVKLNGGDKEVQLKIVTPPDFVGEMAVFLDNPRTATVIAIENCVCFRLEAVSFIEFAKSNVDLLLYLSQMMSYRLMEAHDKIVELTGSERSSRMKELLDKLDF